MSRTPALRQMIEIGASAQVQKSTAKETHSALMAWSRRSFELLRFFGIALAAGAVLLTAACSRSKLDKNELKIALGELRSQTAQAKLIASAALSEEATEAYLRAQVSLLADKTDTTRDELNNSTVESGLEEVLSQSRALAEQTRAGLTTLLAFHQDRAKTDSVHSDLDKVLSRLLELEASVR